jgi:acyl-CoA synthetase (AMP-forming)/AMP-acid ligase II
MSVLAEFDEIRAELSAPGQPFELVERQVGGLPMQVYKNLPPNLSHLIVQAKAFADRTFIVSGDRRWTYGEFLPRAAGLAQIFRSRYGLGPGERVAIAMRNSPEWILGFYATILSGATPVAINSRGTADDMVHAVQNAQCALLLVDPRRADALAGSYDGLLLIAGEDGELRDREGRVVEIQPAPVEPSEAGQEDPGLILFTSGTTGRPKGAVLSHRSVAMFLFNLQHNGAVHLLRNARKRGMDPAELAAVTPQYSTFSTWPFFHMSGATSMLLGGASIGAKIVMLERWNPKVALSLVPREKITVLQGPPAVFWDLLACPDFATTDLSTVTATFSGGQALSTNLLQAMVEAFPGAMVGGGFGQTECNGPVTTSTGDEYLVNPKAQGRVVPGSQLRIVDEAGRDLPLGEPGEIWVRSPLVMSGYWNNPEATAAVLDNGWLKTGDVGFLDAQGFVTIVDRIKDMIISAGENIYSAELERVFQEYPGMMEAAAFGVPDPRRGERVVVAIVPHPGVNLDADDLMTFAKANLADYKVPTEILVRPEPFQRNAVGKVDKILLRRSHPANQPGE